MTLWAWEALRVNYILCSRIDKWPAAGVTKPLRFYGEWGFYQKWPADLESARKDIQNGILLIESGAFYEKIDFSRKIMIFWAKSVILPWDFPSFKTHRIEKWDHVQSWFLILPWEKILWRKSNGRIIFKLNIFQPKYINLSGNHRVSTSPALTPNYSLSMRSSTSHLSGNHRVS